MNILVPVLIIIFVIAIIYYLLIAYVNDVGLPSIELKALAVNQNDKTKVLFIYAHPDDETMSSGGLTTKLAKDPRFDVEVISVTHGENGIELLNVPPTKLAEIRKNEFKIALNKLRVKNFQIWRFEDGGCDHQMKEIKEKLENHIISNNIDLVITHERTGIYPHPDHIAISWIVRQISLKMKDLVILYSTIPTKIRNRISLPKKLTFRDNEIELDELEPDLPEVKLPIYGNVINKYKAAKAYKSQNLSGGYPMWLSFPLMPYEYYTTKYTDDNKG